MQWRLKDRNKRLFFAFAAEQTPQSRKILDVDAAFPRVVGWCLTFDMIWIKGRNFEKEVKEIL